MTPQEKQKALVEEGMCKDLDEAAHFLLDSGEIDEDEHAEMLSDKEYRRIYE